LLSSSTTAPEGIAAMINYDATAEIDDCFEIMKDSIGLVKTCSVTYAIRDTSIGEIKITKGDILGMLGGEIEVVAKNIAEGTKELVAKAVSADSEVISVFYGTDVDKEDAEKMVDYLEEAYPHCEVELHLGNQPLYYYIISVE